MIRSLKIVLVGAALVLFSLGALGTAQAAEYLVVTQQPIPATLGDALAGLDGAIVKTLPEVGAVVVESASPDFMDNARLLAEVEGVALNRRVKWVDATIDELPDANVDYKGFYYDEVEDHVGSLRDYEWHLDAIQVDDAWAKGHTGEGALVAVLDTGFDMNHPELVGAINTELSTSFVPGEGRNDLDIMAGDAQYIYQGDGYSHGTQVAGYIAAAADDIGTTGVAPDAELMLLKVADDWWGEAQTEWVAEAMIYAADHGADVINLSLSAVFHAGGGCVDPEDPWTCVTPEEAEAKIELYTRAAMYAQLKGAFVVTSGGNDGIDYDNAGDLLLLPSMIPGVVSVAATGPSGFGEDPTVNLDNWLDFNNYGYRVADVSAPGGNFDYDIYYAELDAWNNWIDPECGPFPWGDWCSRYDMMVSSVDAGYRWNSGTSFASPVVAGIAALIVGKNGGSMNPLFVNLKIKFSADDLGAWWFDPYFGFGRVNAYRAVK